MAIDFRDPDHRRTYSGREADVSWREAIRRLVDPASEPGELVRLLRVRLPEGSLVEQDRWTPWRAVRTG